MSYRLHKFEGALLPFYDPEPDLTQGPVESPLLDSVGGVFDYYAGRQRLPRKQIIAIQGIYMGERAYLVDHEGNRIVDHAGNYLINGTAEGDLQARLESLTELLGKRGRLYREYLRDPSRLEWKQARLLQVTHQREQKNTPLMAKVACVFETLMAAWRSQSATVTSLGAGSGNRALTVIVRGNAPVSDAILTITASATVTNIRVRHGDQGVDWSWLGTLSSGQTLTIDGGAQTIRIGSANAYSNLVYNVGHRARGLLTLAPGTNALMVETNANTAVAVTHHDQWL